MKKNGLWIALAIIAIAMVLWATVGGGYKNTIQPMFAQIPEDATSGSVNKQFDEPEATQAPVATEAPVVQVQPLLVVPVTGAELRTCASMENAKIVGVKFGDFKTTSPRPALAQAIVGGATWVQIEQGDKSGWIMLKFLRMGDDLTKEPSDLTGVPEGDASCSVEELVVKAEVFAEPLATDVPAVATDVPAPAESEPVNLFSAECSLINYDPTSMKYQVPGGYAVPVADLVSLAAADMPGMIFFEGDDFNMVEHHVAVIYGGEITSKGVFENGGKTFKFKDGNFWACASTPSGVPQDETVGTSIWKKWKNLKDEGKGMKVCAYLTTSNEPKCFNAGMEPTLVDVAQADAEYRDCDSNETAAEQTPYGLKRNGNRYTAHAGASYCRTLVVGKLTSEGTVVAAYFSGARNEFSYIEGARFFLIPTAWGVTEMQNFVNTNFPDLKVKVELLP